MIGKPYWLDTTSSCTQDAQEPIRVFFFGFLWFYGGYGLLKVCKNISKSTHPLVNHWILLITSQISPQLAKLQIVAWCTFLYKEIWFGWLTYPFAFFCFHDSRASRKLQVATGVGLWSSNETRRRFLDLFDTNAAGKWGWAGGEEELYIFCKHIVCIYYILYLYTYIFMCVYCSGRICTWLRIAIGLYAWDVHGPHVFQTQPASSGDDPYTPDQLYIRKPFDQCIPVQRNGEMDSWTIGVPGPAFEKW